MFSENILRKKTLILVPVAVILFAILPSCSNRQTNEWLLSSHRQRNIHLGAILPKTSLLTTQRMYFKRMQDATENINKNKYYDFNFTKNYRIAQGPWLMMHLSASPLEILTTLCSQLLTKDVITIIYLTNSEVYGTNAASVQYLLQLTGYLGIPVISWNVDNVGLEQLIALDKKNNSQAFQSCLLIINI
ncbi:uncharacterized protein NPIL_446281 [Nephila pilipes]|uniref:Uncharacterized protein n=1 Tax=Nephila pilipes TaxID=299642 RepID=A0A8X6Q528_NEPPI|nr:uncharacterized protein NPIL_446281 [Nephila pilipes]